MTLFDGGHGNSNDALGAGEGGIDHKRVCFLDLIGGGVLLQDLREGGREGARDGGVGEKASVSLILSEGGFFFKI